MTNENNSPWISGKGNSFRIELCKHYTTTGYPTFKPLCKLNYKASLQCHSIRKDCKDYKESV